ncbi:hypothetical protein K503DRAFT_240155 [Rhizopogon vinicolor AM-OR11-026]|uniref:Uncharacterized protein n=1 Tax=Rhizopogon vinicolor AM-OR11-026 TaxID=1314800 RepID=A0A1B7MXL5_9AGAM|nr:hypothetical protein K503DRAFT_240155 [Rhizopogon vinicolor AM-OR11-026]
MLDFRVSSFGSIGRKQGIDIIKDTILTFSACLAGCHVHESTSKVDTLRSYAFLARFVGGLLQVVDDLCNVLPTHRRDL